MEKYLIVTDTTSAMGSRNCTKNGIELISLMSSLMAMNIKIKSIFQLNNL